MAVLTLRAEQLCADALSLRHKCPVRGTQGLSLGAAQLSHVQKELPGRHLPCRKPEANGSLTATCVDQVLRSCQINPQTSDMRLLSRSRPWKGVHLFYLLYIC